MLQDSLSTPSSILPRLRRDKRFAPCAIENDHEFFANGIFEFNITRILEFLDVDSVRYSVDPITVSSIPDFGGGRLHDHQVDVAITLLLTTGHRSVDKDKPQPGGHIGRPTRCGAELHVATLASWRRVRIRSSTLLI
jgi:hypothetical protein